MEKDKICTPSDKGDSLQEKDSDICSQNPGSDSSRAKSAVATSNKTKAVIASRRNDFFSDLIAPAVTVQSTFTYSTTITLSSTSSTSFSSGYRKPYSETVTGELTDFRIPVVSSTVSSCGIVSKTDFDVPVTHMKISNNLLSAGVDHSAQNTGVSVAFVDMPSTNSNNFASGDSSHNDKQHHDLSVLGHLRNVNAALKTSTGQVNNTHHNLSDGMHSNQEDVTASVHLSKFYDGYSVKPQNVNTDSVISHMSTPPTLTKSVNADRTVSHHDIELKLSTAKLPIMESLNDCVSNARNPKFEKEANDIPDILGLKLDAFTDGTGVNCLTSSELMPSQHQAIPPIELIPAPICVIEPVCIEMVPCASGSALLEPSPERIWGPQVSFLTFSCLDVCHKTMGKMRQVSSTGCLETFGTGHRRGDDHHASKTLSSHEDFTSVQSVSDDEKSSRPEKSPVEDNKLGHASKSFLEFEWGQGAVDSGICSGKKSSSGWSLGWHSPSIRLKRGIPERESIRVTKIKETWKGKVVRTFRRYGSATGLSSTEQTVLQQTNGTFDVPIELCVLSPNNKNLPLFVELCARAIEERGLENQGIYRVPGNNSSVRQMVEDLNGDREGLCVENEKWHDVNVISSLLKLFFRRLPDPLISDKLYQRVIAASRVVDGDARLVSLRKILHDLPPVNFRTFQYLAQHLRLVSEHEHANKMDAHNLAIIFGPTLIRPRDNNMILMVNDMNDQCRVVESIILHCDWFFGEFEDDSEVPRSEESKESTPVSSMSEELLAKAHQLGDFDSHSCASASSAEAGHHREKIKMCRESRHPNDSRLVVETSTVTTEEECQREVVFEIKRYPAYHFSDSSTFCTENAKPKMRRTHSNESLGRRTAAAFGSEQNRASAKCNPLPFNSSCSRLAK